MRRSWISLPLAALLAACGPETATLDRMEAELAQRLARPAEPVAPAGPLAQRFDKALNAAVLADPGYRAARAREAAALAAIGGARALRRPQISGSATAGAIRETDPDDSTTGLAGEVSLTQNVYDGGESRGAIDRAEANALAARAARAERANEAALAAATSWVELWQFDARLALLNARTREMDGLVDQIGRMARNGMLDKSAHDAARRKIADIDLTRAELEGGRETARSRFRRHFGRLPARLAVPHDLVGPRGLPALVAAWPAGPKLRRAAAELLAAEAALVEARAAFRPKVALQAGLASPMEESESTDASAGLRISYTFGDGGRRRASLQAAEDRVTALEAGLAEVRATAGEEMRGALARLETIDRAMPLIARKIALSRSEAETARSQIVTGQSNLRQLVDAEIERYRAEDQKIRMQAERLVLHLAIMAGAGELAPAIGIGD